VGSVSGGAFPALNERPPLDFALARPVALGSTAGELIAELRRLGPAERCVGVHGQLAGQELPLVDAIHQVFATRYGDAISFLPGRLAFYDGEWKHSRYLLIDLSRSSSKAAARGSRKHGHQGDHRGNER
jgi:hypothetical protein